MTANTEIGAIYVAHVKGVGEFDAYVTREQWLQFLLSGKIRPKPPEYWLREQALEGRDRKQAAIVWSRWYKPARKYVIWDQATDRDFRLAGYLDG